MNKFVRTFLSLACLVTLFCCTGCLKQIRAERALKSGERNYQAGFYDVAEAQYLKTLRFSPLNPVAIRQLGLIYASSGRIPQAHAYLKKAIELDPKNLEVRNALGIVFLSVHDLKSSMEQANYVLSLQPTNEDALLLLAESAATPQAGKEIINYVNTVAQTTKPVPAFHLAIATIFMRSGNVTNAVDQINRAYALNPKSASVNAALANVALQQKRLDDADQFFKASAEASPIRSPRRLRYIMFKVQRGERETAVQMLKDLITKAPDYLPAHNALAQVTLAARDYELCQKSLDSILARDNSNYDALMMAGNLALARNDSKAAVDAYNRVVAVYPRSAQAFLSLAKAQLVLGDRAKALGSLGQALSLQPNLPEAVLLMAELNLQKGETLSVISTLSSLLKKQPGIPQAYLLLASAHAARKDIPSALAVYSQMRAVFPKSPEVPYMAASLLARQSRFPDAREACTASLQIATNYFPAVELLVDMDIAEKKFDSAMRQAQYVEGVLTNSAEAKLLQAKVLLGQTNYAKAEEALLQAIEKNPQTSKAYIWLAQMYVNTGKQVDALNRLNTLVSRTNDVTALMQIGTIQEHLKQFEAARDTYERLLSVNPRFSPALNNLAYIYCDKLGQAAKALPLAESARDLLPYSPAAADTLGWVLFRKGDYPRAFGVLQEAASKLPEDLEIQYHLAMAAYMMADEEIARNAFSRAAEATNNLEFVQESRTRLARLSLNPISATRDEILDILKKEPRDPIALSRLASIYARDKEYPKAAEAYEALLKATPQNAKIQIKLAELYAGPLKNPTRALAYAKDAHSVSGGDPEIMKVLGRLVFQSGDYTWSRSLLQEAARKSPNDPELQHALAWALYANGNVAAAQDAMQIAAIAPESSPFKPDAARFLSFVSACSNISNIKSLKSEITAALQTDPAYVPALVASATADQADGESESAIKKFNAVLAKYPNFTPAARQIAILASANPSPDPKAMDLGLRARQAYPQDAALARALGILSYRRGDFIRGIEYLRETLRAIPKDADALYYLGACQLRTNAMKEGKASLEQALALNLRENLATEARKLLAQNK